MREPSEEIHNASPVHSGVADSTTSELGLPVAGSDAVNTKDQFGQTALRWFRLKDASSTYQRVGELISAHGKADGWGFTSPVVASGLFRSSSTVVPPSESAVGEQFTPGFSEYCQYNQSRFTRFTRFK